MPSNALTAGIKKKVIRKNIGKKLCGYAVGAIGLGGLGLISLTATSVQAGERVEDCAFLEQSFRQLNIALNQRSKNPTPTDLALISMYADLQRNLILLHRSRECAAGDLVDIIRDTGEKAQTTLADLDVTEEPESAKQEKPLPKQRKEELEKVKDQLITKSNVNVRAQPSTDAPKMGVVQAGGLVPIVGKVKGLNWYKVKLGENLYGYIFGELLEPKKNFVGRVFDDLKKKADDGDADAQYKLGNYFAQDEKMFEAVGWWQAAAEQNHASAQFNLGVAYLKGGVLPKDDKKAKQWFKKAAKQGNQKAKDTLKKLEEIEAKAVEKAE